MGGDLFPVFDVPYAGAAAASGVPVGNLRSWHRKGELGTELPADGNVQGLTSHQVVRAAALAHFKGQKRNPLPGSLARHRVPDVPFVILLNKERIPVVLAVEDLPAYLHRPSTVVVFDARPVVARLRRILAEG